MTRYLLLLFLYLYIYLCSVIMDMVDIDTVVQTVTCYGKS